MRHAQVCLGEIPLRLKMRKAHSTDVVELETHQPDASAANRALELLPLAQQWGKSDSHVRSLPHYPRHSQINSATRLLLAP
jgi:hypothetical protein